MTGLKISAMNVGPLSCDKNLPVALAPGHVDVPTTSAVIIHPTHGVLLWDTGINDVVSDPDRGEEYSGPGLRAAFGTHGFKREHGNQTKGCTLRRLLPSSPRSCRRHVLLSRSNTRRSARRNKARALGRYLDAACFLPKRFSQRSQTKGMVSASKRKASPTTALNLALVHGALISLKTRVTSGGSVTRDAVSFV